MAKVKSIEVTVTYRVGLGDLEVPKNVLDELEAAGCRTIGMQDLKHPAAAEWLIDNIREGDCFDWKCEIDELQV